MKREKCIYYNEEKEEYGIGEVFDGNTIARFYGITQKNTFVGGDYIKVKEGFSVVNIETCDYYTFVRYFEVVIRYLEDIKNLTSILRNVLDMGVHGRFGEK